MAIKPLGELNLLIKGETVMPNSDFDELKSIFPNSFIQETVKCLSNIYSLIGIAESYDYHSDCGDYLSSYTIYLRKDRDSEDKFFYLNIYEAEIHDKRGYTCIKVDHLKQIDNIPENLKLTFKPKKNLKVWYKKPKQTGGCFRIEDFTGNEIFIVNNYRYGEYTSLIFNPKGLERVKPEKLIYLCTDEQERLLHSYSTFPWDKNLSIKHLRDNPSLNHDVYIGSKAEINEFVQSFESNSKLDIDFNPKFIELNFNHLNN
jgi:hypothetical protein